MTNKNIKRIISWSVFILYSILFLAAFRRCAANTEYISEQVTIHQAEIQNTIKDLKTAKVGDFVILVKRSEACRIELANNAFNVYECKPSVHRENIHFESLYTFLWIKSVVRYGESGYPDTAVKYVQQK